MLLPPLSSLHEKYWSFIIAAMESKYLTCSIVILQKLETVFPLECRVFSYPQVLNRILTPISKDGRKWFYHLFPLKLILQAPELFRAPEASSWRPSPVTFWLPSWLARPARFLTSSHEPPPTLRFRREAAVCCLSSWSPLPSLPKNFPAPGALQRFEVRLAAEWWYNF